MVQIDDQSATTFLNVKSKQGLTSFNSVKAERGEEAVGKNKV